MKNYTPQSTQTIQDGDREILRRALDRRSSELRDFRRTIHHGAIVLLSITAPLSASHPASGWSARLLSAAILSAALALLAGIVVLRAPVRQSQEGVNMLVEAMEGGTESCAFGLAPLPERLHERLCAHSHRITDFINSNLSTFQS